MAARIRQRQQLAQAAKYEAAKQRLAEASEEAAIQAVVEWEFGIGRLAREYFSVNPLPHPAALPRQLSLLGRVFITYYKEAATRDLIMEALRIKYENSGEDLDRAMSYLNEVFNGKLERLYETLANVFTDEQLRAALPTVG